MPIAPAHYVAWLFCQYPPLLEVPFLLYHTLFFLSLIFCTPYTTSKKFLTRQVMWAWGSKDSKEARKTLILPVWDQDIPKYLFFFLNSRGHCTRTDRKDTHTHIGLWKSQGREMNNNVSKLKTEQNKWIYNVYI